MLAYKTQGDGLLADNAPVFVVEKPELDHNRIGTPTITITEGSSQTVTIDPFISHIFAEKRSWQGKLGSYTNLIYRIHFLKVPLRHLTAGPNGGLLTIDEVLERYSLTLEEFASWQRAVDRSGMQGLRVTRIQHYRDLYERQLKY